MQNMHSAVKYLQQKHNIAAPRRSRSASADPIFGGNHLIALGDGNQHDPLATSGQPLYWKANADSAALVEWAADPRAGVSGDYRGFKLWRQFKQVCLLTEQHRFNMDTKSGSDLYAIVQKICADSAPSNKWIGGFIDRLQGLAKKTQRNIAAVMERSPNLVVQRNALKPYANVALAQNHAFNTRQRIAVWRALDLSADNRPLSEEALQWLEQLKPQLTGDMPTIQMFFKGMRYTFNKTEHPRALWINNIVCYGVRLVLHSQEPPDDLTKPYRKLHYLPRGIIVRPEGPCLGRLSDDPLIPRGCLFVPMSAAKRFSIKLPERIQIYADDPEPKHTLQVKRRGADLGHAYTPSTFFAQGISFKRDKYLQDLTPPLDGHFHRANITVPISRPSGLDDVHPLLLWHDEAGRARVLTAYIKALASNVDRVADNARLQRLHKATRAAEASLWRDCKKQQ